jgi:hypothetical protein
MGSRPEGLLIPKVEEDDQNGFLYVVQSYALPSPEKLVDKSYQIDTDYMTQIWLEYSDK